MLTKFMTASLGGTVNNPHFNAFALKARYTTVTKFTIKADPKDKNSPVMRDSGPPPSFFGDRLQCPIRGGLGCGMLVMSMGDWVGDGSWGIYRETGGFFFRHFQLRD